jgi:hypothetical protein
MIVGVLTTCHTQYTWDRSVCIFYLIEQHSKLLLHTLQVSYRYVTETLRCVSVWTAPLVLLSQTAYQCLSNYTCTLSLKIVNNHLRMDLSDSGRFPNLERNCRWTIVTARHLWCVITQNAISLPLAAILVNCAPSGEMHNYCTPPIIKENFENFFIHRCNYILLS